VCSLTAFFSCCWWTKKRERGKKEKRKRRKREKELTTHCLILLEGLSLGATVDQHQLLAGLQLVPVVGGSCQWPVVSRKWQLAVRSFSWAVLQMWDNGSQQGHFCLGSKALQRKIDLTCAWCSMAPVACAPILRNCNHKDNFLAPCHCGVFLLNS